MNLQELYPFPEECKSRKRLGRGSASGWGCTAGRGNKGQNARSGGGVRPGFEGGQMPLQRRLPKHGFKNYHFKTIYNVVNLTRLAKVFADKTDISIDDMYDAGLAPRGSLIKILGDGELTKPFNVEAHKFSASAVDKLAKASGSAHPLEASDTK